MHIFVYTICFWEIVLFCDFMFFVSDFLFYVGFVFGMFLFCYCFFLFSFLFCFRL